MAILVEFTINRSLNLRTFMIKGLSIFLSCILTVVLLNLTCSLCNYIVI